jgi:hypothetical protein|tara:strand:+ start:7149 stop:7595 length:447 start_codon:yes stop_codon:yes gene_type:complete
MATRKQFSRALYEAYDAPAKDKLVEYLVGAGHEIKETQENFYVDIVSEKDDYTYFNEAEVKLAWKEEWPTDWKDIRIPERKGRLLSKYEGEKGVLNFYIFRKDMKQVWRIKDTSLRDERLREARGRNILKGELFYHIPYTEAELINVA